VLLPLRPPAISTITVLQESGGVAIACEVGSSGVNEGSADSLNGDCGNVAGNAPVVVIADDDVELVAVIRGG